MDKKPMRDEFGEVLITLGEKYRNLMVLEADTVNSSRTPAFASHYPDRYFNVGIAEKNMVSMASGMALEGMLPFVVAFGFFTLNNALDQIRVSMALNKVNVVIIGLFSGMTDESGGSTHHNLNDYAILRSMPEMKILVPSTAADVKPALKEAIEDEGPAYIQISRLDVPQKLPFTEKFTIGKNRVLKTGDDITILSNGMMLQQVIQSAEILAKEGIKVEILEIGTVKPLDKNGILNSVRKTGAAIIVEEHNVNSGLGSTVAKLLMKEAVYVPMDFIGINDCFTLSGSYPSLLEKYELNAKAISERVRELLARR